jgi:hypothetical protein
MRWLVRFKVALLCVSAVAAAEPAPERANRRPSAAVNPKGPLAPAGTRTGADVVRAEDLRVADTAAVGAAVPVSLLIKNLGTSSRDIPWRIARNDQVLASGVVNLRANATVTVGATWPSATAGSHWVYVDVDPDNTFLESVPNRRNNTKGLALTVAPSATPVVPPPVETQELDFARVKAAGGHSGSADVGVRVCGTGERLCKTRHDDVPYPSGAAIFIFEPSPVPLAGARVDGEAYKDFQLKNGWRLKEVLEPVVVAQNGTAGWSYSIFPNAGSASPYMKMHLWTDGAPLPTTIAVAVRVLIEGPAGTNPYQ